MPFVGLSSTHLLWFLFFAYFNFVCMLKSMSEWMVSYHKKRPTTQSLIYSIVMSLFQWNLAHNILIALATKCRQIFHFNLVMFLHYLRIHWHPKVTLSYCHVRDEPHRCTMVESFADSPNTTCHLWQTLFFFSAWSFLAQRVECAFVCGLLHSMTVTMFRGRVYFQCPTVPSVTQPPQPAPPACLPLAYQALQFHAVPFEVRFYVCFYPRDAMLARVFATATCLSVRPSVTRRYCA